MQEIRKNRRARALPEKLPLALSHADITVEMERELIRRAQMGDRRAERILIQAHNGAIWKAVKRYSGKGLAEDDLLQCGRLGFSIGIHKFDLAHDTRLTTYATLWSRAEARRELCDTGSAIRLPAEVHDQLFRERKARALTPSSRRLQALLTMSSLDAPVGDGPETHGDLEPSGEPDAAEQLEAVELHARRRALILRAVDAAGLRPFERDVLERLYLASEPETMAEIGRRHGRSSERVRQVEGDALRKVARGLRRVTREEDVELLGAA